MGCPRSTISSAILRVDFPVHFNRLIGSPAVFSSIMCVRSFTSAESRLVSLFLRPPSLRIFPSAIFDKSWPLFNSFIPFRMVGRDSPVNSYIRFSPPRPRLIASLATYQRDCASFRVDNTFSITSSFILFSMLLF